MLTACDGGPAGRRPYLSGAGLDHGQHGHGPSINAGDDSVFPAQWSEPVLGIDPAGSRHDIGAVAAGFRSDDSGDGRDLCYTGRANLPWNSGSASGLSVANGWHNRSDTVDIRANDTNRSGQPFYDGSGSYGRTLCAAVGAASYIIHVGLSRHDHTGAAAARSTAAAVTIDYSGARTGATDDHEYPLHVHAERHDYGTGSDDVADRDGASGSVGEHSHANRHHYDREHLAGGSAWQFLDDRMQFDTGRPTDQRRRFAALDAGDSGESSARYDSAGRCAAWRHQYRSDSGGYANAEYVGMCREPDDEPGDPRHDGAGQRLGRRGNAGRIAAGLLTAEPRRRPDPARMPQAPPWVRAILKCYLMVWLLHQVYLFGERPTSLAPEAVGG
jgi:hypothetical protein